MWQSSYDLSNTTVQYGEEYRCPMHLDVQSNVLTVHPKALIRDRSTNELMDLRAIRDRIHKHGITGFAVSMQGD